jgi:hypothetical protein
MLFSSKEQYGYGKIGPNRAEGHIFKKMCVCIIL